MGHGGWWNISSSVNHQRLVNSWKSQSNCWWFRKSSDIAGEYVVNIWSIFDKFQTPPHLVIQHWNSQLPSTVMDFAMAISCTLRLYGVKVEDGATSKIKLWMKGYSKPKIPEVLQTFLARPSKDFHIKPQAFWPSTLIYCKIVWKK